MSTLPLRPSLASLRKQAKSLLRGFREKAPEAHTAVLEPDFLIRLVQQDRLRAVCLLLDLGTDPNALSWSGRGALHEAAWAGYWDMIRLLLDRGARLDVRSRAHGGTAVGYAHHAGRADLRDWLLERSPDPLDLASHGRAERLASLLQDPEVAERAKRDGERLASLPRDNGDLATMEVLRRFGVIS